MGLADARPYNLSAEANLVNKFKVSYKLKEFLVKIKLSYTSMCLK